MNKLTIKNIPTLFYKPKLVFTPDINLEKSYRVLYLSILSLGLSSAFYAFEVNMINGVFLPKIMFFGEVNLIDYKELFLFLAVKTIKLGFTSYLVTSFLFWIALKIAGVKTAKLFDTASLLFISLLPMTLVANTLDIAIFAFPDSFLSNKIFYSAVNFSVLIGTIIILFQALRSRHDVKGMRFYIVMVVLPTLATGLVAYFLSFLGLL